MKRRTKVIITLAATGVIAIGIAGLAKAGKSEHCRGYGQHHMGKHYGQHHRGKYGGHAQHLRKLMDRYDANKDGKLDQSEIDSARKAKFEEFDTDKDGNLSLEEYKSLWLARKQQRMVRSFQHLDPSGDAKITLEEYLSPMSGLVTHLDHNGDKAISKDDFKSRSLYKKHKRYDDHDDDHKMEKSNAKKPE